MNVCEILTSPDGNFLAMVSAAEGATILEIIDLQELLQTGEWKVLREINPFPGQISIRRWRGRHLEVESDLPLFLVGRKIPDSMWLLLPAPETFLVNPIGEEIHGVSITLKRLFRRIKSALQGQDPERRNDALRTLAAIGGSLPPLPEAR